MELELLNGPGLGEDDFADFLTVSAELCDDVSAELCGLDELQFYPSASATFSDNFTLGTEFFDVLDNLFADDFSTGTEFGEYSAPVAFPVVPTVGVVPSVFAVEVDEKVDESKLVFVSAFPEMSKDTTKVNSWKFQAPDRKYSENIARVSASEKQPRIPPLTVEDKRQNRLKAITTWMKKRERLALKSQLPIEPVRNARKEAAARRIRLNGKFLKQNTDTVLEIC
jgi:hypothetical protein